MNPIDLEIYWNRLIAITDEAGAALKRTSFSTVVRRRTTSPACSSIVRRG